MSTKVKECENLAKADEDIKKWMDKGKLMFKTVDLTAMPEVCTQSCVDAIIDYGGLDSVLNGRSYIFSHFHSFMH